MVQLVYPILFMFFKVLPLLIFASAFSNEIIETKYKGFNISFPRNEQITVTKIVDGDTVHGVTSNKEKRDVRFHCIDTPESVLPSKEKGRRTVAQWHNGENIGEKATNHIKTLIKVGDKVRLEHIKDKKGEWIDKYGRPLGVIWKGDLNINLQMAQDGYAYEVPKYCSDIKYDYAIKSARDGKLGLYGIDGIEKMSIPDNFRKCINAGGTEKSCNPTK
jgi:endonuclease YncB( thermonuclease family)